MVVACRVQDCRHDPFSEKLPVAENIKKVESREKKRLKIEQKRQVQI